MSNLINIFDLLIKKLPNLLNKNLKFIAVKYGFCVLPLNFDNKSRNARNYRK